MATELNGSYRGESLRLLQGCTRVLKGAVDTTTAGQPSDGSDQIGGATIQWTIIGGADGFVVNPGQFYFSDGSYTSSGVAQPPGPTYQRVGAGQEYSFSIDYTHLSDPNPGGPAAGYVYAPGSAVAVWN